MIASLALGFGGAVVSAGGRELDATVGPGSPAQIEYTMPSDVLVLIPAMTSPQEQYVCGPGAIVPALVVLAIVLNQRTCCAIRVYNMTKSPDLHDKTAIT